MPTPQLCNHKPKGPSLCTKQCLAVLCLCAAMLVLTALPLEAEEVGSGEVLQSFQSSAKRWGVPVEILMAVGYVESRWEQRDGEASLDRGYGIMHLVEGPVGTLEKAAQLTSLPEAALRLYAQANIEGGAAVLSDISRKLREPTDTAELSTWYDTAASYSGATDASVRDGYAREVFRVIQAGATARLRSGETVVLPPTEVGKLPPPLEGAPMSIDYGPALWVPAHSNNYSVSRQYGPLNFIVIHTTEGSYNSAISWFQNPNSYVSAHYVLRSSDGQVTQMVRNADTAYHAGNWDYNVRSLGVEHEGFILQPGWYTEAMYQASAALVRTMADRYGIKKDRAHIVGHSEVPGATHQDPGPLWNWNYYMSLVRQDSRRAALVDNTNAGFVPVPPQIDPEHYWWIYGGGHENSNTYVTGSVANIESSYNSGTWTTQLGASGSYDVYAFVPYVDNNTADTANARYRVHASDGTRLVQVSQQAITDVGSGSWAHLGRFTFTAGADAAVYLNDYTGEWGRNVWFDAVMWIPTTGGGPGPTPTVPPVPTNTPTPLPVPTWTPGPCGMRFIDLPDYHWAYSYVSYLYCRNVVSGYPDGTFHPDEGSTRGQLAKMIVLGFAWNLYYPVYPTFTDVPIENSFYPYVETAHLRGILGGYPDGTFRPNNAVTRAQAAKMLVLASQWPLQYPPHATFTDVPVDHWAFPYVETATGYGIIGGYADGTFRPDQHVTRAQLSKMLALTLQQP